MRAPNPVQVLSQIKLRSLDGPGSEEALPQFTVDPKGPLALEEDKFFNFGVAEAEPPHPASSKPPSRTEEEDDPLEREGTAALRKSMEQLVALAGYQPATQQDHDMHSAAVRAETELARVAQQLATLRGRSTTSALDRFLDGVRVEDERKRSDCSF